MRTFVLSVALVFLASCGLWAADGNLVANGGFETLKGRPMMSKLSKEVQEMYGGIPDAPFENWAFGGTWDKGQYSVHVSDDAHSGKHAVEIRCEKKGRGGIACAPFKLTPGTILKVSFWVKAKGATDGRLMLNYEGTAGDGWNRADIPKGTYDWQQVTHYTVVPSRRTAPDGQTIVLFFYSKAKGSLWIDDVSAETVDVNKIADAPDEPALLAPKPADIPEPPGSPGYRIDVATTLDKVLPDTDYKPAAQLKSTAAFALARNEYEGVQVVVEAPWRDVTVKNVAISDLVSPAGKVIPKDAFTWWRVDFVETTITPNYAVDRVGWYPDPMMPAEKFTVAQSSRVPVWVSLHAPKDAAAGVYRGSVTVLVEGRPPAVVPLTVTVYDFTLTDETHLRTLTWFAGGGVRYFYSSAGLFEGLDRNAKRELSEKISTRYEDILLEHRLGPGGQVASVVRKNRKTGKYNFAGVDARLERLIGKGMNAFIMGTAPNLRRQRKKVYSPQFIANFTEMLKAYGDHLREKGWIDKAYVYTFDEAPRSYWGEVKKIAAAIKKAAPELRILQCLNQPKGVKELAGHVDVFDVYIQQYHRTGVAEMQKTGTEAWLAICCYPSTHPNLFIEYPLIDARLAAMFCWKYKAAGFEYWSPVSWRPNTRKPLNNRWPNAPWNPNTFGRYNGDGYLLYPGPGKIPYPSIRLKALRDGFEDYEYMWTLNELVKRAEKVPGKVNGLSEARGLLNMNAIIADNGNFNSGTDNYFSFRDKVAEAIAKLSKSLGGK